MKKKIILAFVVLLVLYLFYFVVSRAFISITVINSSNNELVYTLHKQGDEKPQEIISTTGQLKKMVKNGIYEIQVEQNDQSHFVITSTKRFLRTTEIEAVLKPEIERTFVGNDPLPCMLYVGDSLISYMCNDTANRLKAHAPATETTPTFTKKSPIPLQSKINGNAQIGNETYVFLQSPRDTDGQGPPFAIYKLDPDGSLRNPYILEGLDENKTYHMRKHKSGVLIHNESLDQFVYVNDFQSPPVEIPIGAEVDNALEPYSVHTQDDTILISYTNNRTGKIAPLEEPDHRKLKAEILIIRDGIVSTYKFKRKMPNAVYLCGINKLCLVNHEALEVYDISSNKPDFLYKISDVLDIAPRDNKVILVRSREILLLDVEKKTANIEYNLGQYGGCGISFSEKHYLLCISSPAGGKFAILLEQNKANTTSIDKKLLALSSLREVKRASAYKNLLFVTPEQGDLVYDARTRSFIPNPETVKTNTTAIKNATTELEIDTSIYKIINFFD